MRCRRRSGLRSCPSASARRPLELEDRVRVLGGERLLVLLQLLQQVGGVALHQALPLQDVQDEEGEADRAEEPEAEADRAAGVETVLLDGEVDLVLPVVGK